MNAGDRATSSTSCSRGWALRATVLPAGGGESSILDTLVETGGSYSG